MNYFVETERLLIRELIPSDAEGMFVMDSDPEVHTYVGKMPKGDIEEIREVIGLLRQQYADYGVARWAVIEKDTNDFVGWTGFKFMKEMVNGHSNYYDFGYRLARKHWGKGYATESGIAALHYGIDNLKLRNIYAMTDIDNLASRKVLEKLGLKYVETFNYDAEPIWREPGQPTTWYRWME